jgi:hypothetical protein
MTLTRKDPIASHAYTLPVVREIPIQAGTSSGYPTLSGAPQPVDYAADAHAW